MVYNDRGKSGLIITTEEEKDEKGVVESDREAHTAKKNEAIGGALLTKGLGGGGKGNLWKGIFAGCYR